MILLNRIKKSKKGFINFLLMMVLFIALWALWLGAFLQEWGEKSIKENSFTGFEAFVWANLNLWVFLFFLLGVFIYLYVGGPRRA